jgi:hypothetical protein
VKSAGELLELRMRSLSIFEHRADFEPAAHSFDVFGQGGRLRVNPQWTLFSFQLRYDQTTIQGRLPSKRNLEPGSG